MNRLERWIVTRKIRGWEKANMEKITAAIAWLNAAPGRKRGVAAILLGISAAVRAFGHTEAAQAVEAFNEAVQMYVVPGMDIAGFLFAVVGILHAKSRKV